MISLNEVHNIAAVLDNIEGWASEVFLVDSYSHDNTVDIALSRGVHVVQRPFNGFGDQWNFAVTRLPITAPWTMKLDPDERLTDELKASIEKAIAENEHDAFAILRRLWFMGKPMPVRQRILRLWRTGSCRFSNVTVNEHPIVKGRELLLDGDLEHYDSPNLHHWYDKQNRYTTSEALAVFKGEETVTCRLFGTSLERRMWLKRSYRRAPFRHKMMFLYCLFAQSAWLAGGTGFTWARLRAEVYRMIEAKIEEMERTATGYEAPPPLCGEPHPHAIQAKDIQSAGDPYDHSIVQRSGYKEI